MPVLLETAEALLELDTAVTTVAVAPPDPLPPDPLAVLLDVEASVVTSEPHAATSAMANATLAAPIIIRLSPRYCIRFNLHAAKTAARRKNTPL
jgi:hypothetical protein